ncbi:hypothetical protein Lal_00020806 [Lupinus albus]|nr:hypothetical protein Lal_00020806 [Lupinus albus]
MVIRSVIDVVCIKRLLTYDDFRLCECGKEVKEALKKMENDNVVGLNNIPIEGWKDLGEHDINWLTKLFNEIMNL